MTPASASRGTPLVLLPPSEGKEPGGGHPGWEPGSGAFGHLSDARRQVAAALAGAAGGSAQLLGVSGPHLERSQAANRSLVGAPTLPAWRRYSGVVWSNLAPATLHQAAVQDIVVVSGLLGLVRGDDPLPDYRIKMSAALAPLGKLSAFWRDQVTAGLEAAACDRYVVDLLPREHRAAWRPGTGIKGVSVELVDRSGKPGGHFAKAAKGRLAREILLTGTEAIGAWRDERFGLVVSAL